MPDDTSAEHLILRPKLCQVDIPVHANLIGRFDDPLGCIDCCSDVLAILVAHWTFSNIEQSFAGNQFIVIKMHVLEVVHQLETL